MNSEQKYVESQEQCTVNMRSGHAAQAYFISKGENVSLIRFIKPDGMCGDPEFIDNDRIRINGQPIETKASRIEKAIEMQTKAQIAWDLTETIKNYFNNRKDTEGQLLSNRDRDHEKINEISRSNMELIEILHNYKSNLEYEE